MKVNQLARSDYNTVTATLNDILFILDGIVQGRIKIRDDYSKAIISKNIVPCYEFAKQLAHLDLVARHRVSEIRTCMTEKVPLSEKDCYQDLANGIEVKRSSKIQVRKKSGKTQSYWKVSNISNKIGELHWELSFGNRRWKGIIPREVYAGRKSLSMACDMSTGAPSQTAYLARYFKEA